MEKVIKALAQSTIAQQQAATEANRHHEEAMVQQQETTRLLVAQFTVQQETTQAQVAALQEAMQCLAQGQEQTVGAASNQAAIRASDYLQKLTPSDDVEAFIATFREQQKEKGGLQTSGLVLLLLFSLGIPRRHILICQLLMPRITNG